jgi:hypothetical protein
LTGPDGLEKDLRKIIKKNLESSNLLSYSNVRAYQINTSGWYYAGCPGSRAEVPCVDTGQSMPGFQMDIVNGLSISVQRYLKLLITATFIVDF